LTDDKTDQYPAEDTGPNSRRARRRTGLGWLEPAQPDIAQSSTAAIVIHPAERGAGSMRDAGAQLEEAVNLARAILLTVAKALVLPIRKARPSHLFGSGQVSELAAMAEAHHAQLVIVDGILSPVQQRNLETDFGCKVIDRTGLILEIFGDRAQSREGVLQVELAHLTYQQSRLVRSWTHLERQRGGFGFLGGPGETQIETDRRLIRDRIASLRTDLEQVKRTRALHRKNRQRRDTPLIALVGYTNAGKSTLFNTLTAAKVVAKDMLFATLDPTMRGIELPGARRAILSDTVGFVSNLPTQLVAAFRATLEEVRAADVLLHVRDCAHPDSEAQRQDVEDILAQLGIGDAAKEPLDTQPRIIEVLNKVDLLGDEQAAELRGIAERRDNLVVISAHNGSGTERLLQKIATLMAPDQRLLDLLLPFSDGRKLAWLYRHGEVIRQEELEEGVQLQVKLSARDVQRFEQL
jgi:GTPase